MEANKLEDYNLLPLVSIIITSYNRAQWIEEAIKSALAQNYPNLEIVISDNCSTDNTEEIINNYLFDHRIKYFKNVTNIGMVQNFKKAISLHASGKYFLILNSDDRLENIEFIKEAVRIFQKYDNVHIVFAQSQILDENFKKIIKNNDKKFYEFEYRTGKDVFINYSGKYNFGWDGVVMERDIFNSFRIFENEYTTFDTDSNLRFLLIGDAGFIKKYCYTFRIHKNNISIAKDAKECFDNLNMIEAPCKLAIENNLFNKRILHKWKKRFLIFRIRIMIKQLYKYNKKEHSKFVSLINTHYNLNMFSIIDSRLFIYYVLFYYTNIGNLVQKIKHKIT